MSAAQPSAVDGESAPSVVAASAPAAVCETIVLLSEGEASDDDSDESETAALVDSAAAERAHTEQAADERAAAEGSDAPRAMLSAQVDGAMVDAAESADADEATIEAAVDEGQEPRNVEDPLADRLEPASEDEHMQEDTSTGHVSQAAAAESALVHSGPAPQSQVTGVSADVASAAVPAPAPSRPPLSLYPSFTPPVSAASSPVVSVAPPAARKNRFGDAAPVILESIPTAHPCMPILPPVLVSLESESLPSSSALSGPRLTWSQDMIDLLFSCVREQKARAEQAGTAFFSRHIDWTEVNERIVRLEPLMTAAKCAEKYARETRKQMPRDLEGTQSKPGRPKKSATASVTASATASASEALTPVAHTDAACEDEDDEKDTSHSRGVAAAAAAAAHAAAFARRRMALSITDKQQTAAVEPLTTDLARLSFAVTQCSGDDLQSSLTDFVSQQLRDSDFVFVYCGAVMTRDCHQLLELILSHANAHSDLLFMVVLNQCKGSEEFNPQLWLLHAAPQQQWLLATAAVSEDGSSSPDREQRMLSSLHAALTEPELDLLQLVAQANQHLAEDESQDDASWQVASNLRESLVLLPSPLPADPVPTAEETKPKKGRRPAAASAEWSYTCCPCKARCDVEKCPCIKSMQLCVDCKPGIGYCANRDANRVATSDKRVRKQAKPDGEYLAALEAKPAAAAADAKPALPKPSLAAAMMMHVKKTQPKPARPLVRVTPDSVFINRLLVDYQPPEQPTDAAAREDTSGDADESMAEHKDAGDAAATAPAGRPCRHTCGCVKHGQTLHPRYVRGRVHREKHEHNSDSHPNHRGSACTFPMTGEASAPTSAVAAASSRPAVSSSVTSPRSVIPPPSAKSVATPTQPLKQIGLTDDIDPAAAAQSKKRGRWSSPIAPHEDAAPAVEPKQPKTEQATDVKGRSGGVRIPIPGLKSNAIPPASPANAASATAASSSAAAPPSVVAAVAAAASAEAATSAPLPPPSPARPAVPAHIDNSARFFGSSGPVPIIKKANSPVAIKRPEPIVPQAATKSPTLKPAAAPHSIAAPTPAANSPSPARPPHAPPPAAAPIPRSIPSLTLPPKGDPMHFIVKKRILCPFLARCNFGDTCGYSHDVHTAARLRLPGERDEPVVMAANGPASSALPPIRPPVQAYMPVPPLHAVTFSSGDMKAQTCTTTGPLYGETSKHETDVRYAIAAARCRRFKFCVQGRIPGAPPASSSPSTSEAIADAQRVINFLKARGVLAPGQFDLWWAIRPPAGASAAGIEQIEIQLAPTGPSDSDPLNLVQQAADKLRGVDVTIRSLFTTADRQLLQQDEQELAQQTKRDLARRDETRNREQRRTGPGVGGAPGPGVRSRSRSRERDQHRDRMHENERNPRHADLPNHSGPGMPRPTHEPPPGISAANLIPLDPRKARVPMFATQPPQANVPAPVQVAPAPWNMHQSTAPPMAGAPSLLGPYPMHAQPPQQPPQQPMQQPFGMKPPMQLPASVAPASAPAVVSAAVSPPIFSVILQHGMCLCVFAGPATHDLNAEPLRSLLARRRILLDGFPIGPQYAGLRSDAERLLDANDVIRQCTGSQWLSDQDKAEINFLLRHRESARIELQFSSEERRNACLAKKSILERFMPAVRIWAAEQALFAAQPPSFNQQQQQQQQQQQGIQYPQQQQQHQPPQQPQQRSFHLPMPGAPQPPPPPPAAAPSANSFQSPLGGVPSNPSVTALYVTYGTAPQDGSVLFDTANAPSSVYHPDGSETLMQPNADEMTRRADEVRKRQVLLCHLAPAAGWPFLPGPPGDAARLDDARTVFSLFSRAYSLPPGSTDLLVRYLVRLQDQRVVVQFASESMLEDLARRDPRALHELGWAIQRTSGTYLVAPAIVPPRATNAWGNQPTQPQQPQPQMQMHHQPQQQQQQCVPFQQQQQLHPQAMHQMPQQPQSGGPQAWSSAAAAGVPPNNFNSAPGALNEQQQRSSRFGPTPQRPAW